MDCENNFIAELIRSSRSWDDETLTTLASRGLLRRAEKDLAAGLVIEQKEVTDVQATFRVGTYDVNLSSAGLGRARCSCPAPGVCQHILSVALFLRQKVSKMEEAVGADVEIESTINFWKNFPEPDAIKWLSLSALRLAYPELTSQEVKLEPQGSAVRVHCSPAGVRCQFGGEGPDGVILLAQGILPRDTALALALLALWSTQGRKLESSAVLASAKAGNVLLDRKEHLQRIQSLLETLINRGLTQASTALTEQLSGMAVATDSIPLPRLANALRALASDAKGLTDGMVGSDPMRLLNRKAATYALAEGLLNTYLDHPTYLVGESRRAYRTLPSLELYGVGAHPWRVASGYAGVTLLFWSNELSEWFSYTEARPERYGQPFDPVRRFEEHAPWLGSQALRQLSTGQIKLFHPKCSPERRLSSSVQTQVIRVANTRASELKFGSRLFTNWEKLAEYAVKVKASGLREIKRDATLVVLKAAEWKQRWFDITAQVFHWAILDDAQRPSFLEIAHDAMGEAAIAKMESLIVSAEHLIIGHVRERNGNFVLNPISILTPDGVDSIYFKEIAGTVASSSGTATTEATPPPDEPEESGDDEETEREISALSPLKGLLLSFAERGLSSLNRDQLAELEQRGLQMESHGLTLFKNMGMDLALPGKNRARRVLITLYLITQHESVCS